MLNRGITLVLCFFLAEMLVLGLADVVGALLTVLPDGLVGGHAFVLALLAGALWAAIQYGVAGVLFALWAGLPWREGGLWVAVGVSILNLINAGRGVFADSLGLLPILVVGAPAAFAACWKVERDEHERWVERAREMLDGLLPN